MKARYLLPAVIGLMCQASVAQETRIQYLSGTDKDHTVQWQFFCSDGMKSGEWTTIAVPSCWELQGFGGYNYGWDRPPHHEQGHYKHAFQAPEAWKGQRIFLTFEGVMTDATVSLNGQLAGPTHQGAFYRFQYEVTDLLKLGQENVLEVLVDKESANKSVNEAERRADYWIFGGIFRPVYLEIKPQDFIERVTIDARHDGNFSMQAFPSLARQTAEKVSVEVEIQTLDGQRAGKPIMAQGISSDGAITLAGHLQNPLQWTSETPNLYQAVFRLKNGRRTLHEYRQRFGFRTIEVRQGDGFYINGVKVLLKGVNRHTIWPETGRTISPAVALEDVRLIKEMNMNAVRMSHYPPDSYFLDYCDSLGLYVLDELAGWQSKYDTPTAQRLVGEMVRRDVNHPCILFWDNGNEGGFNTEVRGDYAVWDPQHRHVLEPFSQLDGVDTKHYPGFAHSLTAVSEGSLIYMPTESLHGLHDGGHGAGLEDYWETLRQWKLYAGQFLWDLTDEGVIRHDRNDTLDAKGNLGTDGILGPHHEKEGSFYTIKRVWSPVFVRRPRLDASWDGTLAIENRYHFTDLAKCTFTLGLTRYTDRLDFAVQRADSFALPTINLKPGEEGNLRLPLPEDWRDYDMLRLTARDAKGLEICTWQWPIVTAGRMAR
ncbi:MAG: glycoside hydrolase family 2, partial [Bacteroidales bacterium]|nr:glycoside hydrolase family 2 [Bacteroidales bacterium]